MLRTEELPSIFVNFRNRWSERDDRMAVTTFVVGGEGMTTTTSDDEDHVNNASPNLVQVGIEDTAESAALMPTIRALPYKDTKAAKATASKMERIAAGYLDRAGGEMLLSRSYYDLVSYGFFVWTGSMDSEVKLPRWDQRQAVGCYPEPGWRPGDSVRRCLFARDVYRSQLPPAYQALIRQDVEITRGTALGDLPLVTLCEYYDEDEVVVAALFASQDGGLTNVTEYKPVVLERYKHGFELCPVVIGQRITLDGEPRGQFDQVIEPMLAHARLMNMAIDYADQAVYSEIWVKDPLGPIPYGGGGIIQLGPNGAIGRVPPATSSLSLFQELEHLMDAIHLGGRWPKSRIGEVDQSIASAKFLETSVGVMNTAIRTYHFIMRYAMEKMFRVLLTIDKHDGRESATSVGILRNQQFICEYNPQHDIDLDVRVTVEYGLGLGRDPSQSAVLHIQYAQAGMISKETVQESIEGINDVERERRRIDVEKLLELMFSKLMLGVQQGSVSDQAVLEIAKARLNGDDMMSLYEKHVVAPQQSAAASAIPSGMGGPPSQPGAAGAAPPGLAPPPPPDVASSISRLSSPVAGGGFAGTEVKMSH